ncbi:hypothetical protein BDZ90DRAFT_229298 [Jaminaea rosea]|uniref:protein-histidine N-methyltransferase n=1 Tax=Jaminaea rosea TaxID=1569628 RepID=A0A316UY97_9BASI|nr:hypothetical protein BDZ90DRAFT_229298 [Jaminaea rosea]PWN30287.1 hypothetical protein BDZ90DRAFT_229298 [Jaminaea rosea]
MSFSFNFASSGDDFDNDVLMGGDPSASTSSSQNPPSAPELQICPAKPGGNDLPSSSSVPSRRLDLDEMLDSLPDRISYSWVQVPLPPLEGESAPSSSSSIYLPRRDLFDARFQILHDDDDQDSDPSAGAAKSQEDDAAESAAVVGTESDLIPGLYEGGLKTWESSVDLVGVLHGMSQGEAEGRRWRGRIVELGCGTALPSMYILRHLIQQDVPVQGSAAPSATYLHLCDYNAKVLQLVTLPNLLLAYHFARHQHDQAVPPPNGELDLDPQLLSQFRNDLTNKGVEISFHAGPWDGLRLDDRSGLQEQPYANLVLTSETTYRQDVVRSLVATMRSLLVGVGEGEADGVALVATKDYYFGLGGGVMALKDALSEDDTAHAQSGRLAQVETRSQSTAGVKRSVLAVSWPRVP